ncbi:polymeric immunoglobulin receptor-like [Festucalex cinctus]
MSSRSHETERYTFELAQLCFAHEHISAVFSALEESSVGLVTFRATEGQNATIWWRFSTSGKKYFCKDNCKGTDALVETYAASAERGRHSINYDKGNLYAFIVNLNMADSGRYRIGVGSPQLPNSYSDFQIQVLQAGGHPADSPIGRIFTEPSGGTLQVVCPFRVSRSVKFFCKGNCLDGHILVRTAEDAAQVGRYSLDFKEEAAMAMVFLRVTITQLDQPDSGRYSCALGPSLRLASIQEFDVSVTEGPTHNSSFKLEGKKYPSEKTATVLVWPLILCGVLVLLLLTVVLLLLYKWKAKATSRDQRFELNSRENAHQDGVYQTVHGRDRDLDHTYCTLKQGQNSPYENNAC